MQNSPAPLHLFQSRVLPGAPPVPGSRVLLFATALLLAGCISDTFILDRAFVDRTTPGQPSGEITLMEHPVKFFNALPLYAAWSIVLYDEKNEKYPGDLFSYPAKLLTGSEGLLATLTLKLPEGRHKLRIYYFGKVARDLEVQVEKDRATVLSLNTANIKKQEIPGKGTEYTLDLLVIEVARVATHRHPDAFTALANDLKSSSGHCRWKAVEELRRLGDKRAIPLLEAVVRGDPDNNVRHYAGQAVASLQQSGSR